MEYARGFILALAVVIGACTTAPGGDSGTTRSTTSTPTTATTAPTTASTTFSYDTGFGNIAEQTPAHYLYVTEVGFWDVTGSDDAFSGQISLQEYIDELDIEEGPDCFVVWSWTGTERPLNTCAGCDFVMDVSYTILSGDVSTCQTPDLPSETDDWQMGWIAATNEIVLNVGDTGVWAPWYTGVRTGDRIDITFNAMWPIDAPDEEMTE